LTPFSTASNCWNTTFGYFEEEKNLAVAGADFQGFETGGTFLIDVINRDFVTTCNSLPACGLKATVPYAWTI